MSIFFRKNSHPNIIGYVESFECTTSTAIIFELARGGELFDYVWLDQKRGTLSEKVAKMQFYQVTSLVYVTVFLLLV